MKRSVSQTHKSNLSLSFKHVNMKYAHIHTYTHNTKAFLIKTIKCSSTARGRTTAGGSRHYRLQQKIHLWERQKYKKENQTAPQRQTERTASPERDLTDCLQGNEFLRLNTQKKMLRHVALAHVITRPHTHTFTERAIRMQIPTLHWCKVTCPIHKLSCIHNTEE